MKSPIEAKAHVMERFDRIHSRNHRILQLLRTLRKGCGEMEDAEIRDSLDGLIAVVCVADRFASDLQQHIDTAFPNGLCCRGSDCKSMWMGCCTDSSINDIYHEINQNLDTLADKTKDIIRVADGALETLHGRDGKSDLSQALELLWANLDDISFCRKSMEVSGKEAFETVYTLVYAAPDSMRFDVDFEAGNNIFWE